MPLLGTGASISKRGSTVAARPPALPWGPSNEAGRALCKVSRPLANRADPASKAAVPSRCWAAPLTIQCGADGFVYNCVDWRGDPRFVLGSHYPDPRNILDFWGGEKHLQLMKDVNVDKCPRCTYGIYAQQIENAVLNDDMCVNFP